jgi:hypothetical protein
MAKALLMANALPLAQDYAHQAFAILQRTDGAREHLRVPYHELLARIAWA